MTDSPDDDNPPENEDFFEDDGEDGNCPDVIEIDLEDDADIEQYAPFICKAMERMGMDAVLNCGNFSLEFEQGCEPGEIVEAYRQIVPQTTRDIERRARLPLIKPPKP